MFKFQVDFYKVSVLPAVEAEDLQVILAVVVEREAIVLRRLLVMLRPGRMEPPGLPVTRQMVVVGVADVLKYKQLVALPV